MIEYLAVTYGRNGETVLHQYRRQGSSRNLSDITACGVSAPWCKSYTKPSDHWCAICFSPDEPTA